MTEPEAVTSDRSDSSFFKLDNAQTGSNHPECLPGEIFLSYGNSWTRDILYGRYATRRTGTTVIDDFGQDRTGDAQRVGGLYPIFVEQEEFDRFRESLSVH